MIYIVSGPINTGKTSWLLEDFKKRKNADGFASRKVRENGIHIGYELVHLKTGETCQSIRKPEYIPDGWNEAFRIGLHYSFSKDGLMFAEKITNDALASGIDYFYLDEVAQLELKGQGFAHILRQVINSNVNLMLVVRERMVERIVEAFGIQEYKIIIPEFD